MTHPRHPEADMAFTGFWPSLRPLHWRKLDSLWLPIHFSIFSIRFTIVTTGFQQPEDGGTIHAVLKRQHVPLLVLWFYRTSSKGPTGPSTWRQDPLYLFMALQEAHIWKWFWFKCQAVASQTPTCCLRSVESCIYLRECLVDPWLASPNFKSWPIFTGHTETWKLCVNYLHTLTSYCKGSNPKMNGLLTDVFPYFWSPHADEVSKFWGSIPVANHLSINSILLVKLIHLSRKWLGGWTVGAKKEIMTDFTSPKFGWSSLHLIIFTHPHPSPAIRHPQRHRGHLIRSEVGGIEASKPGSSWVPWWWRELGCKLWSWITIVGFLSSTYLNGSWTYLMFKIDIAMENEWKSSSLRGRSSANWSSSMYVYTHTYVELTAGNFFAW